MIKVSKISKEEYCQCTSCQRENKENDIYKFDIGKTQQQTVTIRLCYGCLCDFMGKSVLANNGIILKD